MRNCIKFIVTKIIKVFSLSRLGQFVENALLEQAMTRTSSVKHRDLELFFVTPNPLTKWRATTFSSKEPETLQWIDAMSETDVFWDIGANVGVFSIYAAKRHNLRVFSFEPSVFNLELLARNCNLNKVADHITIIPLALSENTKINKMRHTTTAWGGALSSFGTELLADGKIFDTVFEYSVPGISVDSLIEKNMLPPPNHVKIDVDGIEHLILRGAQRALFNVKSVLVEVNEDFHEQIKFVTEVLEKSGLQLTGRYISPFSNSSEACRICNQIWERADGN